MISQYKIESQIDLVNSLKKKFEEQTNKLNDMIERGNPLESVLLVTEMDTLTTIRNVLVEQEEKLKEMQEEFDKTISPLKQVKGYKGKPLFKMTVPNNTEKIADRVKEYGSFIVDQGYYVNSVDKQKGYLSTVYTFFVSKT